MAAQCSSTALTPKSERHASILGAMRLVVLLTGVALSGCPADPQTLQNGPDVDGSILPSDVPAGLDVPATLDTTPTKDAAPDQAGVDAAGPDATADASGDGGTGDGGTADGTVSDANPDGSTDAAPDGSATPDIPTDTAGPGVVPRSCIHTFSYTPSPGDSPAAIYVPGSFNGWDETLLAMTEQGDGSWTAELELDSLAPGSYGYKIRATYGDGSADWRLDPANKMKRFDDNIVNSKLLVPDCSVPELELLERTVDTGAKAFTVEVAVRSGKGGQLDLASPTVLHNGQPLSGAWDADRGTLLVELSGLANGKHTLVFEASASTGEAEPLMTSVWFEDTPFEWRDSVMYFAFVDRFNDVDPTGQPSPCTEADPLGNWLGGDWPGITQKIEAGYFDSIGVNTLWLNAPMDNPDVCAPGLGGFTYTSYHGYHPSNLYEPEEHFGDMDDLRALVKAAHERGIRVLIDLVVNHIHQEAQEWIDNEFNGWFNTPAYVCGWDQPETCWFTPALPDLDFRNDEVVEYLTEAALWWIREADLDGFRVDAVKHIHPHLLYTLRAKLDQKIEVYQDLPFWTVGETFVGTWGNGSGEETVIKQYISDDQLYGQFDFPLYWATLSALGRRESPMTALSDVLQGVTGYFAGDLMASFLGNHDVARYVSHANGDIGDIWGNGATEQGWNNPPGQPGGDEPYERLEMAFVFLAATPWVPLIYYGDEVGLAGAGDPDNRRMMPWTGVSPRQEQVRTVVGQLMAARTANRALRRGSMSVPQAGPNTMVVVRTDGNSQAVGLFNVGNGPSPMSVGVSATTFTDAETGETYTASNGNLSVTVPPGKAMLLVTAE